MESLIYNVCVLVVYFGSFYSFTVPEEFPARPVCVRSTTQPSCWDKLKNSNLELGKMETYRRAKAENFFKM